MGMQMAFLVLCSDPLDSDRATDSESLVAKSRITPNLQLIVYCNLSIISKLQVVQNSPKYPKYSKGLLVQEKYPV